MSDNPALRELGHRLTTAATLELELEHDEQDLEAAVRRAEDEQRSSDKAPLSPAGRQRSAPAERSDDSVAEGIGRMIRALGKRAAKADPDAARLFVFLQGELDDALAAAVAGWRAAQISDAQIGRELGVSKQAVQQRWPRSPER